MRPRVASARVHSAHPAPRAASFLERLDTPGSGANAEAATVFEAVCQASCLALPLSRSLSDSSVQGILYVLIYRIDAFSEEGGASLAAARSLPLERLLSHASDPLRACAPAITLEYARRATAQRMPGRHAARVAAAANGVEPGMPNARGRRRPLDTFFPFDPYLLRRSAAQLELKRTYMKWQSSEGYELDYDSDRSTASGLDGGERSGSMADSYREQFGVAMQGLARPAPLGGMAMSYEEGVITMGAHSLSLN